MHVAIVVYAIASVEKVLRTIGSLLLFKTGEMDRGHQCGIDHPLYLNLKIEIVDCAVVCPYLGIRGHSSCLDILHGRRICTIYPSVMETITSIRQLRLTNLDQVLPFRLFPQLSASLGAFLPPLL